MDLICLYGLIDNLGALLGIGSNSLLIWIIFRVAKGKLQLYSYLVLISSIFDLFFSVIEQLLVRHGILFVMAHGIESQLGDWAHYFCMIPHIFSCTHSVLILGLCYEIVTSPSLCTLLKYTAVSSAASLFVGCSAGVGIFQAKQRGFDYYMAQMDGPWFNEKAKRFLTYACDIRDIGTICFYGGALVFTTICFWMSVYAVWKTFSFIRDSSSQLSERTAALQRQFTIRDVEVFGCFVTYDLISIR
ncbi:hypothetical protein M3Y96_01018800 [Aphelenchoides besseyi]|nr:hypothetical protein M3Y96_01018800 [Aphelenchoides besseyi]